MTNEIINLINEDTEVVVLGFPDPINPNVFDFKQRCALKDSLLVMKKHLEELDESVINYYYYDFLALYIGDEKSYTYLPLTFNITGKDKLLYGYDGETIRVAKEFEGLLHFSADLKVEVY